MYFMRGVKKMRLQLQRILEERAKQCVSDKSNSDYSCAKTETKKESLLNRSAEIVKAKATGKIINKHQDGENENVTYHVHFQYVIKQKDLIYLEEETELRTANFFKGTLIKDEEIEIQSESNQEFQTLIQDNDDDVRQKYNYNRLKAVQYAETWWNDYNPAFKRMTENDCTNFISQCLYAGGAPMRGYPNRGNGWWIRGNTWSWSWTVANTLKNYLGSSKVGLRAREVSSPAQLMLGDVICYDFEGDGRYDHNTIVTARDYYGMPLVNAHTYNSRHRYWEYKDSTRYTPNIKYKFYTIVDDE
jgi:hypothetical protein